MIKKLVNIKKKLNSKAQTQIEEFFEELENEGYVIDSIKKEGRVTVNGILVSEYIARVGGFEVTVNVTNKGDIFNILVDERIITTRDEAKTANYKIEGRDAAKYMKILEVRKARTRDIAAEKRAKTIHEKTKSKKQKELEELQAKRDELKKELEKLQGEK